MSLYKTDELNRLSLKREVEGMGEGTRALRQGVENARASITQSLPGLVRMSLGDEEGGRAQILEGERIQQEAAELGPRVQQIEQIDGVGTALEYARNLAVGQLPNIATAATGAGLGVLGGRLVAQAGARGLARKLAGDAAGDVVERETMKAATELAGIRSAGAREAAARLGGVAGASATGTSLQTGETAGAVLDPEAKGDAVQNARIALGGAALTGSLETIPALRLLRQYGVGPGVAKAVEGKLLARMAKQGAKQGVSEGGTELAQQLGTTATHATIVEDIDKMTDDDAISGYFNAVVGGALGGFIFGAPSGIAGGKRETKDDTRSRLTEWWRGKTERGPKPGEEIPLKGEANPADIFEATKKANEQQTRFSRVMDRVLAPAEAGKQEFARNENGQLMYGGSTQAEFFQPTVMRRLARTMPDLSNTERLLLSALSPVDAETFGKSDRERIKRVSSVMLGNDLDRETAADVEWFRDQLPENKRSMFDQGVMLSQWLADDARKQGFFDAPSGLAAKDPEPVARFAPEPEARAVRDENGELVDQTTSSAPEGTDSEFDVPDSVPNLNVRRVFARKAGAQLLPGYVTAEDGKDFLEVNLSSLVAEIARNTDETGLTFAKPEDRAAYYLYEAQNAMKNAGIEADFTTLPPGSVSGDMNLNAAAKRIAGGKFDSLPEDKRPRPGSMVARAEQASRTPLTPGRAGGGVLGPGTAPLPPPVQGPRPAPGMASDRPLQLDVSEISEREASIPRGDAEQEDTSGLLQPQRPTSARETRVAIPAENDERSRKAENARNTLIGTLNRVLEIAIGKPTKRKGKLIIPPEASTDRLLRPQLLTAARERLKSDPKALAKFERELDTFRSTEAMASKGRFQEAQTLDAVNPDKAALEQERHDAKRDPRTILAARTAITERIYELRDSDLEADVKERKLLLRARSVVDAYAGARTVAEYDALATKLSRTRKYANKEHGASFWRRALGAVDRYAAEAERNVDVSDAPTRANKTRKDLSGKEMVAAFRKSKPGKARPEGARAKAVGDTANTRVSSVANDVTAPRAFVDRGPRKELAPPSRTKAPEPKPSSRKPKGVDNTPMRTKRRGFKPAAKAVSAATAPRPSRAENRDEIAQLVEKFRNDTKATIAKMDDADLALRSKQLAKFSGNLRLSNLKVMIDAEIARRAVPAPTAPATTALGKSRFASAATEQRAAANRGRVESAKRAGAKLPAPSSVPVPKQGPEQRNVKRLEDIAGPVPAEVFNGVPKENQRPPDLPKQFAGDKAFLQKQPTDRLRVMRDYIARLGTKFKGVLAKFDAELSTRQQRKVGATLPNTSPYTAKDQAKADKATKFIGRGSAASSTNAYAKAFGDRANSGVYTADDTVFVSAEGNRSGRVAPDPKEIKRAMDAGATILTDNVANRQRSYNVGEREVASFLAANGYTEKSPGVWVPVAKLLGGSSGLNDPVKAREDLTESLRDPTQKVRYSRIAGEPNPVFAEYDRLRREAALEYKRLDTFMTEVMERERNRLALPPNATEGDKALQDEDAWREAMDDPEVYRAHQQLHNPRPNSALGRLYAFVAANKAELASHPNMQRLFRKYVENYLRNKLSTVERMAAEFVQSVFDNGMQADWVTAQLAGKERRLAKYKAEFAENTTNRQLKSIIDQVALEIQLLRAGDPDAAIKAIVDARNLWYEDVARVLPRVPVQKTRFSKATDAAAEDKSPKGKIEKLQAIVDDIVERLKLDAITVKWDKESSYDPKTRTITLNNSLRDKKYALVETVFHEIGHAVVYDRFAKADKATKQAIAKDFNAWRKEYKDKPKEAWLSRSPKFMGELLAANFDEKIHTEDATGFHEYMADNIAKALMGEFSKDTSPVGTFFKTVANALQSLYRFMAKSRYKATPNVQSWVDSMLGIRQVPATNPALPSTYFNRLPKEAREILEKEFLKPEVFESIMQYASSVGRIGLSNYATQYEALINIGVSAHLAGKLYMPNANARRYMRESLNYMQQAVGLKTHEQLARAIMKDLEDGNVDADYDVRAKFADNDIKRVALKARRFFERNVLPPFQSLMSDLDERVRSLPYAEARRIAAMINLRTNEQGGESFSQALQRERNRWSTKVFNILDKMDAKRQREVLDALQAQAPIEGDDVTALRAVLDEFHTYLDGKVITVGVDGPVRGVPRVANYFPVLTDPEYVRQHEAALRTLLSQPKFKKGMATYFKKMDKKNPWYDEIDFDDQASMVEHMVKMARYEPEDVSDSGARSFSEDGVSPGMRSIQPRVSAFIYKYGNDADKAEFAKFQSKDLSRVMLNYIASGTKRAEYDTRFATLGTEQRGDKVVRVKQNRLNKYLADMSRKGASKKEIQLMRDYIDSAMGNYNQRVSPLLQRVLAWSDENLNTNFGEVSMGQLRAINSVAMTYQNFRLLTLAAISSFVDPIGSYVRGGSARDSWDSFREAVRSLRSKDPDVLRQMAQDMGVVENHSMIEAMSIMYGGSVDTDSIAGRMNNTLFKYNGLEYVTRVSRLAAFANAHRFIARHAATYDVDKNSKRYLAELGLKPSDVVLDERGFVTRNDKVDKALFRFVDEAVLRPKPTQRPLWQNDPNFAILAQYKGFLYSLYNTIARRLINEVGHKNYRVLVALVPYIGVTMAVEALREFIQHGPSGDERRQNWGVDDHLYHAVDRTGLLGPKITAFADAEQDNSFGSSVVNSISGPTAQQIGQLTSAATGDRGILRTTVEALPGSALFEDWIF